MPSHSKRVADVPMSESTEKYREDWTFEDCKNELRRIAEAHPDQVITRNFFRTHAGISEATWSRYAGTFKEFKRQAGIVLTRHQHRMELDIAKHASVDKFREMNVEKSQWEGKYLRPNRKRFQTILAASDLHDIECDLFWRRSFVDTAKRVKPDVILINGDALDLPEFGRYPVDPRTWDVVGRISWLHQLFRDLREASPDSEFVYNAGNHEDRLLRHLAEASPAMRAVLSDLHGFTVSRLLGLEQFEINFISRSDLATFTASDAKSEVAKNYWVGYECFLAHHFPEGRQMGFPGISGHHHRHLVWDGYSPTFGSYEWHQLGCGHKRAAEYCAGEKWSLGFALIHIDTERKRSVFDYIQIHDHAVIGGKWMVRQEAEVIHAS